MRHSWGAYRTRDSASYSSSNANPDQLVCLAATLSSSTCVITNLKGSRKSVPGRRAGARRALHEVPERPRVGLIVLHRVLKECRRGHLARTAVAERACCCCDEALVTNTALGECCGKGQKLTDATGRRCGWGPQTPMQRQMWCDGGGYLQPLFLWAAIEEPHESGWPAWCLAAHTFARRWGVDQQDYIGYVHRTMCVTPTWQHLPLGCPVQYHTDAPLGPIVQ